MKWNSVPRHINNPNILYNNYFNFAFRTTNLQCNMVEKAVSHISYFHVISFARKIDFMEFIAFNDNCICTIIKNFL